MRMYKKYVIIFTDIIWKNKIKTEKLYKNQKNTYSLTWKNEITVEQKLPKLLCLNGNGNIILYNINEHLNSLQLKIIVYISNFWVYLTYVK